MSRGPKWTPKLTPKSARQKDFASLNLQIAKAYLSGIDNGVQTRTWQQGYRALTRMKQRANREHWKRVVSDKAFVPLSLRALRFALDHC